MAHHSSSLTQLITNSVMKKIIKTFVLMCQKLETKFLADAARNSYLTSHKRLAKQI